jgi:hypothetical protein
MPDSIKPERGQVSENPPQSSTKQCCHVFQQDPLRLYQANGSHDFGPKPAAFTLNSGAVSCIAYILTREAGSDHFCCDFVKGCRSDVPKVRRIGPVPSKHPDCVRLYLALRDDRYSCPLQTEI